MAATQSIPGYMISQADSNRLKSGLARRRHRAPRSGRWHSAGSPHDWVLFPRPVHGQHPGQAGNRRPGRFDFGSGRQRRWPGTVRRYLWCSAHGLRLGGPAQAGLSWPHAHGTEGGARQHRRDQHHQQGGHWRRPAGSHHPHWRRRSARRRGAGLPVDRLRRRDGASRRSPSPSTRSARPSSSSPSGFRCATTATRR